MPDYLEWRDGVDGFESAAVLERRGFLTEGPSGPGVLAGGRVTATFFGTLGVTPMLGRDFTAEDDRDGAEPVAIISHRLWIDRFSGSTGVLGRTWT